MDNELNKPLLMVIGSWPMAQGGPGPPLGGVYNLISMVFAGSRGLENHTWTHIDTPWIGLALQSIGLAIFDVGLETNTIANNMNHF